MRVRTVYCFVQNDDPRLRRDIVEITNRLRNFWREDLDEDFIRAFNCFCHGEFEWAVINILRDWLNVLASRAAKSPNPFGPEFKKAVLQSAHKAREIASTLEEEVTLLLKDGQNV